MDLKGGSGREALLAHLAEVLGAVTAVTAAAVVAGSSTGDGELRVVVRGRGRRWRDGGRRRQAYTEERVKCESVQAKWKRLGKNRKSVTVVSKAHAKVAPVSVSIQENVDVPCSLFGSGVSMSASTAGGARLIPVMTSRGVGGGGRGSGAPAPLSPPSPRREDAGEAGSPCSLPPPEEEGA